MSANVESMFYVRKAPWHGLGTKVQEAPDSKQALILAGLDWKVKQMPVYTGDNKMIPGYKANVRDKDDRVLGVVTDRYKVVQNEEAFAFTDELLGYGVRYETAGSQGNNDIQYRGTVSGNRSGGAYRSGCGPVFRTGGKDCFNVGSRMYYDFYGNCIAETPFHKAHRSEASLDHPGRGYMESGAQNSGLYFPATGPAVCGVFHDAGLFQTGYPDYCIAVDRNSGSDIADLLLQKAGQWCAEGDETVIAYRN